MTAMMLCSGAKAHGRHVPPHHTHHTHQNTQKLPETGIATWYANGVHNNKNGFHRYTSNGEQLNAHAMTCAHRSLPFNTLVKVTDVKTKKFIIVRVNDRMRAKPPRIIDLTSAAADALGILHKGTASVTLEPIEVAEAPDTK